MKHKLRAAAVAWFVLLCGASQALAQSTPEPAPVIPKLIKGNLLDF